MTSIRRLRPDGLVHSPAFSHVAVVPPGATTIWVGGQDAVTADGTLVGEGDIAAQSVQTVQNVVTALAAAGATVADVVQWTVLYVAGTDINAAFQAIGPQLAADDPALVIGAQVAGLGLPGALIEISAVAAVVS